MYSVFFLVAALLSCCAEESSVHGRPEQVLVFAGQDVILPCTFNITASDDFPTVEWSKEGLQPNVIFLYRDGCETPEMKNPDFEYRTSLIAKELKNRNISLRISNVRLSDAGKYKCMRLSKNNAARDITTVELIVGAVSEPKLSVVSAETGGVTLQCEANCWLPEPEIELQDHQGNNIPADEPKRDQDASGCYTVTRRVTLQDATKRVTCRVHQLQFNQTRTTEILIPVDCMRSCLLTTCISVGGAVLCLIALCGLTGCLWKRYGKSAEQHILPVTRQPSDQSTISSTYEDLPFLQNVSTDNMGSSTIEKLTREVAYLKSKLQKTEETIQQLQSDLKSQQCPVVCQLGQPTLVCSPSKCSPVIPKPFSPPSDYGPQTYPVTTIQKPMDSTNSNPLVSANLPQNISHQNSNPAPGHQIPRRHHINSSPASLSSAVLSSSSSNTSKKKLCNIGRSSSVCSTRAGPSVPKLQRRHSFMSSRQSSLSNNPFMPLSNLSEEE